MSLPPKVLSDRLIQRISLLLKDANVLRRKRGELPIDGETGFWRPLDERDLDRARRWERREEVPTQWMNFLFNTDRDSEVVCEGIVWFLTDHFDLTAEEALGRVNHYWLGHTLAGDETLRFRNIEHWAHTIYYGEESSWWDLAEGERALLKPLPYPASFEPFAICPHCAAWKERPEQTCGECGELPEGEVLELARDLSSERIALPGDPIAARIRLLEFREGYLTHLAEHHPH